MSNVIQSLSAWIIPLIIAGIPLYAAYRKVPVYESFTEGAKEGFDTAIRIIPHIVGMMVAISIFRSSGAMDLLLGTIAPLFARLGIPADVLPLALLRPITGAGSLAYTTELIKTHGADSLVARIAATVQGSTDTTLYVLAVYFGAVGIRRTKYALSVGLTSDLVGFFVAVAICILVFTS
jgi:spore maturation protein B